MVEITRDVNNNPVYNYECFLKDHLGNTRAVVALDSTGNISVLQATSYYAFGMAQNPMTPANENKYLYNGKERQDDVIGGVMLDWYDYGARFYDPQIGRFTTQDAYAEKYYDLSSYQYGAGNPIKFIDVNGDSIWVNDVNGNSYYYGYTDQNGYGMYDSNGQLYMGDDKNLNTVNSALARLSLGKEGKALVDNLMGANAYTEIVPRNGASNRADSQDGSYVIWDPNNTNGAPDQNGGTTRDSYIGLGHEFGHVQDVWQGTINMGTWQSTTDAAGNAVNIPYAEIYSTHVENKIRAENGVPLRVSYAKDVTNNPDPSTRIIRAGTSESIYYQQNGTTNYTPLRRGQVPYKY